MKCGEIVIVGGGCYGTFYARQLTIAKSKGKAEFDRLLIVDRDAGCQMLRELGEAPDRRLVVSDWDAFFDEYLGRSASGAPVENHIVPSPLMPHLMYGWVLRRARARWPGRLVETRALPGKTGTPYDTAAPDGTRYLSHADWLCPTHCIEPALCPVTRAPRTWEMSETLTDLARRLDVQGPAVFMCEHRVFGVGSFSVTEVMAGEALVAEAGATGEPVDVLVGTVSSCHGAANLLHLGRG
ncbi:MAG: hypothetical protein ABI742_05230 [Gemmatimonadota bacterium]